MIKVLMSVSGIIIAALINDSVPLIVRDGVFEVSVSPNWKLSVEWLSFLPLSGKVSIIKLTKEWKRLRVVTSKRACRMLQRLSTVWQYKKRAR